MSNALDSMIQQVNDLGTKAKALIERADAARGDAMDYGTRVRIKSGGGMKEFQGKEGTIIAKEGNMYRVKFSPPVDIPGIGPVRDDLWEGKLLTNLDRGRGDAETFKPGDKVKDQFGKVHTVVEYYDGWVHTESNRRSSGAPPWAAQKLKRVDDSRGDASPPNGTVVQEVGRDWKIYRVGKGQAQYYDAYNAKNGERKEAFANVGEAEGWIRKQAQRGDDDSRLKEAFDKGFAAGKNAPTNGTQGETNPYTQGTDRADEWRKGFRQGRASQRGDSIPAGLTPPEDPVARAKFDAAVEAKSRADADSRDTIRRKIEELQRKSIGASEQERKSFQQEIYRLEDKLGSARDDAAPQSIDHDGRLYVRTGKTRKAGGASEYEYEHTANNGRKMTVWKAVKDSRGDATFPQIVKYKGRTYYWTGKTGTEFKTGLSSREYEEEKEDPKTKRIEKTGWRVWVNEKGTVTED